MINLIVAKRLKRTYLTLNNQKIKELFEIKSNSSAIKRKKPVLAEMARQGIYLPNGTVSLRVAYDVWGINKALEDRSDV